MAAFPQAPLLSHRLLKENGSSGRETGGCTSLSCTYQCTEEKVAIGRCNSFLLPPMILSEPLSSSSPHQKPCLNGVSCSDPCIRCTGTSLGVESSLLRWVQVLIEVFRQLLLRWNWGKGKERTCDFHQQQDDFYFPIHCIGQEWLGIDSAEPYKCLKRQGSLDGRRAEGIAVAAHHCACERQLGPHSIKGRVSGGEHWISWDIFRVG